MPIAFDLEKGAATDRVPERDQELNEQRRRVGLGVRGNQVDDLTGQSVECLGTQGVRPYMACFDAAEARRPLEEVAHVRDRHAALAIAGARRRTSLMS